MEKFLELIDLYGKDIKMTLNKQEKITTTIGGTFTLITYIIMFSFFWFFSKDIILKQNPIAFTNQILSNTYPRINLTRTNFPLAFNLVDRSSLPITNSSILYMKLKKLSFNIDIITGHIIDSEEEMINLEPCKYSHFPQILEEDFDISLLNTYFCPSTNSIEIEGYWNSNKLSYLSLMTYKCDYDSREGKNCLEKNEIEDFISYNQINLNVISINKIVSLSNYSNPFKNSINLSYKFLNTDMVKITNFFIQSQNLFTDSSLLTGDYEQTNFFHLEELQTDNLKKNDKDKIMFEMNFYSSNFSLSYYRKYIKIYDILAYLGGIFKVLNLCFYFFCEKFCRIKLFNILIEKIPEINNNKNFKKNLNSLNNLNNDNSKLNILKYSEEFEKNIIFQSKGNLKKKIVILDVDQAKKEKFMVSYCDYFLWNIFYFLKIKNKNISQKYTDIKNILEDINKHLDYINLWQVISKGFEIKKNTENYANLNLVDGKIKINERNMKVINSDICHVITNLKDSNKNIERVFIQEK